MQNKGLSRRILFLLILFILAVFPVIPKIWQVEYIYVGMGGGSEVGLSFTSLYSILTGYISRGVGLEFSDPRFILVNVANLLITVLFSFMFVIFSLKLSLLLNKRFSKKN